MSDKFKTVVTTQGLELLNQAIANEKDLLITKAVASSTAYNSDSLVDLTDTNYNNASHDQETMLNKIEPRGDGSLAFEILFDGYDVRYDYTLNTVFLIAEVDGKERLFAVIKANQPQYINAYEGGSRTNLQINFALQLANQNVAIKINAAALATLGDLDSLKEEFVERIDGVRNTLDNKLQESKSELETKLSQAKSTLQVGISNTEAKIKSYSDNKDKALNDKFDQLILSHVEQLNNLIETNNTGFLLADRNLRNDFEKRLGDEKRFREDAVNELAIQFNNLVSNVQTLDRNIQQSFYNKRRAPATWTLDRTTTPWTIWFDNGCGIQFPDYATTNTMYGYGYSFESSSANKFISYPLVYNIINCARGVLTLEDFAKREGGDYVYWSPTTKVLDPIQDARKYNWTNAIGDPGTNGDDYKRKPNFARVMYELGIWNNDDVESLGAVRR
ncbi:MAG: phage tail protein [Ligilactobacillus animalis]|uniref:hypothetical protein n=1 Tax=Ligilactobacillus animalis TaxID=1605 RepID=UPI00242B8C07|nr:hypothetical protein [Ligilactobacillus animalis]MCI5942086.1 phage tail protein [Ligilactobacillus animalis]MDY2993401.1 hypothetical protein [Ligilactobacillus animalis]